MERRVLALALVFVVLLLLAMRAMRAASGVVGVDWAKERRRCEMARGGWCCSSRAVILREGE